MINFTKLKGGKTMKGTVFRKLMAVFISMMLIMSMAVPAAADEILEGAPGAEETGLTPGVDFPSDDGKCGANCTYSYDEKKGVLTISGTGATSDYWRGFYVSGDTYTIKINSGITELGKEFFCNDPNYWYGQFYPKKLVNVILPKSLEKIGEMNFDVAYFPEFVFYEGTWSDWYKIDIDTSTNDFVNRRLLCKGEWFKDVANGKDFFFKSVYWAVSNGITNGYGEGTFQPYYPCTRAMIVSFLYRAAGSPDAYGTNEFSDVKPTDWYYKAVSWAVEKGITSGYGEGTFQPNAPCSRAMIVTFLKRWLARSEHPAYTNTFPDVSAGQWYAEAVTWAVKEGITSGRGGYFKPNDTCTRGEAVTFIHRA